MGKTIVDSNTRSNITFDNGKEFSNHQEIAEELDCDVFFAHGSVSGVSRLSGCLAQRRAGHSLDDLPYTVGSDEARDLH